MHEFSHAFIAYRGGDRTVLHEGYLSLNPITYAHPEQTFLFPLIMLAFGGLGIPGGAVYYQSVFLRSRNWEALLAFAGPACNGIIFAVMLIPLLLGYPELYGNSAFWNAYSLLAFLQLTAVIINLIPLPGFDGYAIIAAYQTAEARAVGQKMASFTSLLFLGLFILPDSILDQLYVGIYKIAGLLYINSAMISDGYQTFRFWVPK